MENKSIGEFISILRKASGMTQRELAQKLGVSDKAVSRWECGLSAPDLMLIPVIADIFDITSDELLAGQRLNTRNHSPEKISGKTQKQMQLLLDLAQTKMTTRSLVSAGIGTAGLIGAMIANFVFFKADLGFFLSLLFFSVALFCEIIFMVSAYSAVRGDDFEGVDVNKYKREVFTTAKKTFIFILVLLGAALPLIFEENAYAGLLFVTWAVYGCAGALAFALFGSIILRFVSVNFVKRGIFTVEEKEIRIDKLKNKTVLIAAGILSITLVIHLLFIGNVQMFTSGTMFNNYDDFKVYMEKTSSEDTWEYNENDVEIFYSTQDSQDENQEFIYDSEGKVLCQYYNYNTDVVMIKYAQSKDLLPIRVYTSQQFREVRINVNWIFAGVYTAEIILCAVIYIKKRRKIK